MKPTHLFSILAVALLLAMPFGGARADDTEIFFNQTNTNVGANVTLILDTSGSMDDEITSGPPYDATQTYPTSGSCSSANYYWSTSGVPTCSASNAVPVANFKCAAGLPNLGSGAGATGQYGDAFVRWGNVSVKVGKIKTTVKEWTSNLSVSSGTDVECLSDAGVDGNGVDTTNLYPTKNSDPSAVNGIWSTSANSWWSVFGNVGQSVTFYSANYINWSNDNAIKITQTKIKIVQQAVATLLGSVSGVNVALMRYDYRGSGGMVMVPMGSLATNTTLIQNEVNSWAAAGSTPLAQTLYESYLYYSGKPVAYGNNSYSTTCNTWTTNANGAVHCTAATAFSQHSVAASRTGGTYTSPNYDSPADLSCQKNYVIFLTDGQSNANDASLNTTLAGLPNFATLGGACDTTVPSGAVGGTCLGALAQYMYQSDLRNDVAGKQNVTTFFIGFGDTFYTDPNATAYFNYLNTAATRGGGKAYTADGLSDLTAVFASIFAQVQNTNTSFSAPAVAVNAFNRTQTLDDLYVSVFKPSGSFHWPGNVKKYKVTNGVIVDANANAAVNASTGFFSDTSQSYWSTVVDGPNVNLGGAASNLPAPSSRTLYTYLGAAVPASPAALVDISNASVAQLAIGNAGDPSQTNLINWAKGQDVLDENGDGSTTDERFDMGDPIHTQPAAVIYGTGQDDTVLYVPTNDGYLHAINGRTGVENWAYVPLELLNKLKLLYNDDPVATKNYGLDGQITVIKYDINGDGVIDPVAGDRVLIYFGTGRNAQTSAYYALDVTDKANPKFMWMINNSTLPDLGQAWSTPTVARVNIGSATQNSQKLVLIMGGGYDPAEDGYTYVTADAVGNHIYMVDALYGTLLWSAGNLTSTSNFQKARMNHSIPSPVTVLDTNGDGYADRMYVGDMAAQLWRFDIYNGLTAANLVTGGVIASLGAAEESTPLPADTRRFYDAPDVAAVQKAGQPTYLSIAIGSGYRGHPLDVNTVDRMYDIRDYHPFDALTQIQYNALMLATNLIVDSSLTDITTQVQENAGVASNAVGWKLLLNTHGSGEKVLVPARTFNNYIFFTTYAPNAAVSADPCTGVGSGTNRSYIVSVLNGNAVVDRNNSGTITVADRSSDLAQGGIAPETTFLFPAGTGTNSDGTQSGGATGGSKGPVVCLQGVEVLSVCTNYDRRKKTYWVEGTAN